ncbi:MAG: substrate-binding domain-containing protein [Acidimicrobiia bacterium]
MVGARNAAELVGWEYQGLVSSETDSPDTLNATYEQALTLQPDVLLGGMWFDPAEPQAEAAIESGIPFIAVNTARTEWLAENNVPYVGQDLYLGGVLVGRTVAQQLVDKGVTEGLILTGNVSPGSLPIEERFRGIADGAAAFNSENSTNFATEQFPDESADLARSVPIYQAKITEVGDDLVALAGTSTQTHIANYRVAQELGWEPGEYVIGGFDTDPLINEAIREGYSMFTIDQQFFAQGFIAGIQAWQWVERGMVPPAIYDTGNSVVRADNIEAIDERDQKLNELAGVYGIRLGA